MADYKTVYEVCRTCMNEPSEKSQLVHLDTVESHFSQTTIRQKLEAFAPELDLTIIFSSVICTDCIVAIEFIHKFKKKCLETEERIQNYLRSSLFPEEDNGEGTFLQIANVRSLSTEFPSVELANIKQEPPDSDKTTLDENSAQNLNPHLEIVEYESVLFNTDDSVKVITHDVNQESSNHTVELPSSNKNSKNNNDYEYDFTIFETYNFRRRKRTVLYKCNDCSYSITYKTSINEHVRAHIKNKSYQCEQCGFKHSLKTDLISHTQNHKRNNYRECNFATALVSRLNIYIKKHKSDKLCLCIKCNFVADTADDFKSHLDTH